jgi:hypothetical protein
MDDMPFDAWTRRRVGLVTGGLLATALGVGPRETAAKKKRCKKSETKCGKKCVKGTCCPDTPCATLCTCERTTAGKTACMAAVPIACETNCAKDADCPKTDHCIAFTCGDEPFQGCIPRCDAI